MTDEFERVFALGFFDLFHQGGRAGFGDGAEMVDEVVTAHADAVIGDGEGALICVFIDMDAEVGIVFGEVWILNRIVA